MRIKAIKFDGCLKTGYARPTGPIRHPLLLPDVTTASVLYLHSQENRWWQSFPTKPIKAVRWNVTQAADFAFVTNAAASSTCDVRPDHAFNHEQEQAIINAFYGVKTPRSE